MDPRQDYRDYLWAPFTQMGDLAEEEPLVIVSGDGAVVTDNLGREFIDGHAALWLANVGFRRPEIQNAIAKQAEQLSWFPSFGGMSNNIAVELAKRLVMLSREEEMARVFFSSGGSESVETAIKMARQYFHLQGQAQRYKIIARRKAYHGVTYGALSATGVTINRRLFEPLVPGFRHINPPYCYRCPYGLMPEECQFECALELEELLLFEGPETVAAFIGEPVMGAGGVIIPPDGYWQTIERICRSYGVLLIADEVITGFGRTGEYFGGRHWDLKPDIMVFAKALTSGYLPLGATAVRKHIFEASLGHWGDGREFRHGVTYSGHPIACAAALANLDIIDAEALVTEAREKGQYLKERLATLERFPVVGHTDALGLIARLELVQDKKSKRPFPKEDLTGLWVSRQLLKRGIILRPLGDVISFSPPLVITREQIDKIIDVLSDVLLVLSGE